MRKTLLFLAFTVGLGVYTLNAQITVYETSLFNIGAVVEYATDTLPTSISIGNGGASQVWNLSALNEHSLDTASFVDPTPLPGSSNFPSSNLGVTNSQDEDAYFFFTKDASGLNVDGQFLNINPTFVIPMNQLLVTFPSTMGTTFNQSMNHLLYSFGVGFDPDGSGPLPFIDSVKVRSEIAVNSNVDGWGDITTPYGTFASLRQIVVQDQIDSTFTKINGSWSLVDPVVAQALNVNIIAFDTIRTARWWTDNSESWLVEMDYEANGTVNNVVWQKSTLFVGIEEEAIEKISIYPNPTANQLNINSTDQIESVIIYDLFGAVVQRENTSSFSVENLASGVYLIEVKTIAGVAHGRFVRE
jgi:hypothetical protein